MSNNYGTSPKRFHARLREELSASKMAQVVRENITVSDEELKQTYLREHDRVMATLVRFDRDITAAPEPSAAAVQAVLDKEPQAVKDLYEKEALRYSNPQQVKTRQILKKLAQNASDADVAKAHGELMSLRDQITEGADFSALAQTHSDDEASKNQGGDLGFIRRGQMAKPITDALFALKSGEITAEPIRSPAGLHLMQVTEIKPAGQKEFDEVKEEVAVSLIKTRAAENAAKLKAQKFLDQLRADQDIEKMTWTYQEQRDVYEKSEETGSPLPQAKPLRNESAWVLKTQDTVPGFGEAQALHTALFALTNESPLVSEPIAVDRGFVIAKLKERETPDLEKFSEQIDTLREQALNQKRSRVFQAWLGHLRKQAEVALNPALFPAPAQDS
ncbi:MAG: peptidylprolyl isomerase [Myxococcota bacterium]